MRKNPKLIVSWTYWLIHCSTKCGFPSNYFVTGFSSPCKTTHAAFNLQGFGSDGGSGCSKGGGRQLTQRQTLGFGLSGERWSLRRQKRRRTPLSSSKWLPALEWLTRGAHNGEGAEVSHSRSRSSNLRAPRDVRHSCLWSVRLAVNTKRVSSMQQARRSASALRDADSREFAFLTRP